MAWASKFKVATGAQATVEITNLNGKKFIEHLFHELPSTTAAVDLTYNANSNSVYASSSSDDGAADGTSISQDKIDLRRNSNEEHFVVTQTINISGEEKLSIHHVVSNNAAGASNSPKRQERVSKFVPSPDANITQIKFNKGSFTNYATDTLLASIETDS